MLLPDATSILKVTGLSAILLKGGSAIVRKNKLKFILDKKIFDNIYVVFGDKAFQQSVGNSMGTNDVPL